MQAETLQTAQEQRKEPTQLGAAFPGDFFDNYQEPEKGVLEVGFAKMYASLGCGALHLQIWVHRPSPPNFRWQTTPLMEGVKVHPIC